MKHKRFGFTIIELLIVIVVVGILAAISIVAYNGVMEKARTSQRESDMAQLLKAITAARKNTGKTLGEITGTYYSIGRCISAAYNSGGVEPKDLPKTHACWVQYYQNLDRLGDASGVDLRPLRVGDPRGNPYMWDENEGEGGNYCAADGVIRYFTGNGIEHVFGLAIPKLHPTC